MGGFAGGDEGGYWDVGALSEDIKKNSLNTPLKKRLYTQTSESSYEIEALSKRGELYGVLSFVPMKCKTFTIEGCEVIELKACTVYQAYRALLDFTDDSDIVDFFH
ncbi:MAG: hypothetical protein U9N39_07040, partial [Campylobacterota bacterium]|nr:hypothetical protein [Campylobacterota bacterium]